MHCSDHHLKARDHLLLLPHQDDQHQDDQDQDDQQQEDQRHHQHVQGCSHEYLHQQGCYEVEGQLQQP